LKKKRKRDKTRIVGLAWNALAFGQRKAAVVQAVAAPVVVRSFFSFLFFF
jgi:hypothetical protein